MKKFTLGLIANLLFIAFLSQAQAPSYNWAQKYGSSGADFGFSIAVHSNGNIYTTGFFTGTVDFDPGAGTYNLTADSTDAFVMKSDNDGNFIWAKKMGGPTSKDGGYSIAVDANENVYVAGIFKETAEFNPDGASATLTSGGDFDGFIAKFDVSGNFQWVKQIKGSKDIWAYSLAINSNGDVLTTGWFLGTADFNPSGTKTELTASGTSTGPLFENYPWDGFVCKHSSSGTFQWAKQFGSSGYEFGASIVLDGSDNIFITGMFTGNNANFNPAGTAVNLSSQGGADIFVAKYNSSGNCSWAKGMGGGGDDWGNGIALDAAGNIFTTGVFKSTSDFDPSGNNSLITAAGASDVYDIFVSKLDPNGGYLWAKSMGGDGNDTGIGIATDSDGNVYTTGGFKSTANFNPSGTADNFTALGGTNVYDNFITKHTSDGTYEWTQQFGGTGDDASQSIKVDANNSLYLTGGFKATTDFDPSSGGAANMTADSTDAFILKLDQTAPCILSIPTVTVADTCGSSTLTSSSTTGTYLWSPGGETTQSITVSSAGTYSVTITEGACSSTSEAATAAPLSIPATPSITVFDGCDSTTLIASTSTGTYLWSPGGETNDTIMVATAGTYSVTITENGCTSEVGTGTAAPIAIPDDPTVSTPVSYCQNSTASQLTATGTDLLWYLTTDGSEVGSSTAPTPSTTTIGQTSYFVSQTVNGCMSYRAEIVVDITSGTAAPTVSPVEYCENDVASPLTATGDNLLWYTAATGGTGDPSAPTPTTTSVGTTSYYVSQTQCGEGPRAQLDVTVKATPSTPIVSVVDNCGESELTASSFTGTLLWSTAETTTSIIVTNAATYSVTQTVNGCESPSGTGTSSPTTGPSAPSVTSPINYCEGETASPLTASGTYLLWYTSETGSTGTTTAPTPSTSTAGSTDYFVSDSVGCESATRSKITVTVNAAPAAPTVSDVSYCQNDVATALTAGGTNLLWYTSSTGGSGSSTAFTPSTTSVGTTNYYVSQTVNSCESDRGVISVDVSASSPAPTVSSPISYCNNQTATALTATGSNLLWYSSATGGVGSSSAPIPSTTTGASYYVSQTVCGESSRAEIVVNVETAPTVTATNGTASICGGTTTPATLTASGATTYVWSPSTGLSASTGSTVDASPTANTTYTVTGTTGNCSSTAESVVTVDICDGIEENNSLSIITIYPNPSNGIVNVSISNANSAKVEITVLDILGNITFSNVYNNGSSQFTQQLDLSGQNSGVYYVKISTDRIIQIHKLVLQ